MYEKPKIEILVIQTEDVLTISVGEDKDNEVAVGGLIDGLRPG